MQIVRFDFDATWGAAAYINKINGLYNNLMKYVFHEVLDAVVQHIYETVSRVLYSKLKAKSHASFSVKAGFYILLSRKE